MIEPNFGEGQLQQCVNSELTWRILNVCHMWCPPVVITQPEELFLGWDTAFFFPWIGLPISPENHGCNFFVQYKLSSLIEGPRGAQFSSWGKSYFRFKIAHTIKENGTYADDYHQWDALKAVADDGYPAFYATNHVLKRDELFAIASQQRLVDEIPWLDVRPVTDRHKFATFTFASQHFILHSDPQEVPKLNGEQLLHTFIDAEQRSLDEDNTRTFKLLAATLEGVEGAARIREAYQAIERERDADPSITAWRRFSLLRGAYQRFLGTHLFRYVAPAEK